MKNALEHAYSFSFNNKWIKLDGGYECEVWKVGSYIVRMCPSWRTDEELEWIYDLVAHCAQHIPQVIAPIKTNSGTDFMRINNRPVLVFPFIEGDRDNTLITEAATALANIHKATMKWTQLDTPRPPSHQSAPQILPMEQLPDYINDPELDIWLNATYVNMPKTHGIMHGDFYAGNILCKDGQIVGIIDWDECRAGPIIEEIAWSIWEFCHTESGDMLDTDQAQAFLNAYRVANPILSQSEYGAIIRLIRNHLRYEIRRSLAAEQNGEDWDDNYRQQEIRAFTNLRRMNSSAL